MTHCSSTCNAGKKKQPVMHPISDWLSVVRVVMWLPSQSGFNYQSSCHTPNTLPAFSASGDTGHQKHARACVCVCGLILHQVSPSPKSITARYIKICYCGELGTHPLCCPSRKIHSLFCNSDLTHSTCIRKAVIGSQASWSLVEASWSLSYLFWK